MFHFESVAQMILYKQYNLPFLRFVEIWIVAIILSNPSRALATEDSFPVPGNAREEKLFIVQIQNTPCQVGSANGTCYLKDQCVSLGGEVVGTCQNGLGSCCKFEFGCSNASNYRTIKERGFTLKDNKDCEYEIIKLPGYCQLKIELNNAYSKPKPDGICADGTMTIEGSVTVTNFQICGSIKQPLYASYGQGQRPITLSFSSGGGDGSSNYEVKVTRIKCDARDRVPDHCLVEYTGRTGKVESFGYDSGWIADQKYNACIRKSGTSIKWTKCDHSKLTYAGTPAHPSPSKDFILSKIWGRLGSYGDSCREGTSYVSIQGNRFCGNHFPDEVTTVDEPFALSVNMKRDAFLRIPMQLIVWPPFLKEDVPTAVSCKDAAMYTPFNNGTLVAAFDMCYLVTASMTLAADKFLKQCACLKQLSEPTEIDPALTAFTVGFCLEYTQS